jgi:hypothetical protein
MIAGLDETMSNADRVGCRRLPDDVLREVRAYEIGAGVFPT